MILANVARREDVLMIINGTVRSNLVLTILLWLLPVLLGVNFSIGQGNYFVFEYDGPDTIYANSDCEAVLDWGHPNEPTVTYNGPPGGVLVSFKIFSISGGYQEGDTIMPPEDVTVSYIATDNQGNDSTFTFELTIWDSIPPQWISGDFPPDVTLSCLDSLEELQPSAIDNCTDSTDLQYSFFLTDSITECQGGVTHRVFQVMDGFGNVNEYQQRIELIKDDGVPVFTNSPNDTMIWCDDYPAAFYSWANHQIENVISAEDASCNSVVVGLDSSVISELDQACGSVMVPFYAEDQCGNRAFTQGEITIQDSVAPNLLTPAMDGEASCDQPGSENAFDNWLQSYGGMMVEDNCELFWEIQPEDFDLYSICNSSQEFTFIARDRCGDSVVSSASFTLTDTTAPVLEESPSNLIAACGNQNYLDVVEGWLEQIGGAEVQDFCSRDSQLVVRYELGGEVLTKAEVLDSFDRSAQEGCMDSVRVGSNFYDQVLGALQITFLVEDLCGNELRIPNAWLGLIDLSGPQILEDGSDTTMTCADTALVRQHLLAWYDNRGGFNATDDCGVVQYSASVEREDLWSQWLQESSEACGYTGEITVDFFAEDLCGNQVPGSQSLTFSVIDTMTPQILESGENRLVECTGESRDSLVIWLDQMGFTTVEDACTEELEMTFSWSDNQGNSGSGIVGEGPYPNLPNPVCDYRVNATFVVADDCGNEVSFGHFYYLVDNVGPDFVGIADTLSVACGGNTELDSHQVVDQCSNNFDLVFFDDTIRSGNPQECAFYNYQILREYQATDACGNSNTFSQVIELVDTVAPEFKKPEDVTISCVDWNENGVSTTPDSVIDQCGSSVELISRDSTVLSGCDFTVLRTWTATDVCGNERSKVQVISVIDDTPPEIVEPPGSGTFYCGQEDPDSLISDFINGLNWRVEENCSEDSFFIARPGSYDLADSSTWPQQADISINIEDCEDYGGDTLVYIPFEFVTYDACLNTNVAEFDFLFLDTLRPEIECPADTAFSVSIDSCIVEYSPPVVEMMKTCAASPVSIELEMEGVGTYSTLRPDTLSFLLEPGSYRVSLTARSCNDRSESCTYVVEISDPFAPSFDCPSDTSHFLPDTNCTLSVALPTPLNPEDNCSLGETISYTYSISGATQINAKEWIQGSSAPIEDLNGGDNNITYVLEDASGNRDSCTLTYTLIDTIEPEAICQPSIVFVNPSGVVDTEIDPSLFDGGSGDNCGVTDREVIPSMIDCSWLGLDTMIDYIVFDEFGNSDTCRALMRVEAEVLQPTYELDLCEPDTLTLFPNPPPPGNLYTYEWEGPGGFSSNQRNPVLTNVGPGNSGTYSVTVTGIGGCESNGSVTVNISDLITPDLVVDFPVSCEGQEVRLLGNQYSQPATYFWYEGLPPGGTLLGMTQDPNFTIRPTPGTHDYYLVVETEDCLSNPSLPIQVEVISQPIAEVETTFIEVCEGESIQLKAEDQGPGFEYRWTGPNGFFETVPEPPVINNATQNEAGVYQLRVNIGDCVSSPTEVEVVVNEKPAAAEVRDPGVVCEGEDLSLTVLNPLNADVYYWKAPDGSEFSSTEPVFQYGPASVQANGVWEVNSEIDGCLADSSTSFRIDVEILPPIDFEIIGQLCEGDSVRLVATEISGGSYLWTGPQLSESGRIIDVPVISGEYNVQFTSENGCEVEFSRILNATQPAAITALSNTARDCIEPGTNIELLPTLFPEDDGTFEYRWSGPNQFTDNDSIGLISDADQSDNGIYKLVVVRNGCPSDTAFTEVDVTVIPEKPVIEGGGTFCQGETATLTVDDPGMGQQEYFWETPLGDTVVTDREFMIDLSDTSRAGVYRLRTAVNGCESDSSEAVIVDVVPLPMSPAIGGDRRYCEGDSILLFPEPYRSELEYKWVLPSGDTLEMDSVVVPNAEMIHAGVYRLGASLQGCGRGFARSVDIDILQRPQTPEISSVNQDICLVDDEDRLQICIDQSSASPSAVYQWYEASAFDSVGTPTGALCQTIEDLSKFEDGINGVIVQANIDGCLSSFSIPVSVNMSRPPIMSADAGPDKIVCGMDTVHLEATLESGYSGQWNVLEGSVELDDPNSPQAEVLDIQPGGNRLEWVLSYDACQEYASDEILVTFDDLPIAEPDVFTSPINESIFLDITSNDDTLGPVAISILQLPSNGSLDQMSEGVMYVPNSGFIGNDTLVYELCSSNCPELCSEAIAVIQVGDESLCEVPTIFSPNNDGVNDQFIIQCLSSDDYPNNEVIIFNQNGDEVFYAAPYRNNWEGTYKGAPLPVGTYYYIVDFGDGQPKEKGFLILER